MITHTFNGHPSTIKLRQIPARPSSETEETLIQKEVQARTPPPEPVRKEGFMTKLGFKKTFGMESWQHRHFVLDGSLLQYFKDGTERHSIQLNKGCKVRVVGADTPARKDRFEDNDTSMSSMMTNPIGSVLQQTSGVVGKDNCVELMVPVQIGNMLNGVFGASPLQMAFGGGMKHISSSRARTYYFFGSSRSEAEDWCAAIGNNITAMPAEAGNVGGAFGGIDVLKDSATNMMDDMATNAMDPTKSLGWYRRALETRVSASELYAELSRFYDELDRAGVPHL